MCPSFLWFSNFSSQTLDSIAVFFFSSVVVCIGIPVDFSGQQETTHVFLQQFAVSNVLFTLNRTTLLSVLMNTYLNKKLRYRDNIFHFKAFCLIICTMKYLRIFQKFYDRVTMTVYVKCVVRFNVNKTLCEIGIRSPILCINVDFMSVLWRWILWIRN